MKKTIKLFGIPILTIDEQTPEQVKQEKIEKQKPEGEVLDFGAEDFKK
jgi:hypothetical protein